jgi:hypothetical protein
VIALRECLPTQRTEAPRAEEARHLAARQRMITNAGRQRFLIPLAGVNVDAVAVGQQSPGQVGDVGLTAAAGRQNTLMAKGDFHNETSDDGWMDRDSFLALLAVMCGRPS